MQAHVPAAVLGTAVKAVASKHDRLANLQLELRARAIFALWVEDDLSARHDSTDASKHHVICKVVSRVDLVRGVCIIAVKLLFCRR